MNRNDPQKQLAKTLIARADAARDQRAFAAAAALYEAAIELRPQHAGLHMQAGHMHKEARSLDLAEVHYGRVVALTPNDPEIHLQLGHFYKTVGRYEDAEGSYSKALNLRPEWEEAQNELLRLRDGGRIQQVRDRSAPQILSGGDEGADDANVFIDSSLFPQLQESLFTEFEDEFVITRIGGYQRTRWGEGNVVRGIDAFRGYIISDVPYLHIYVYIDGALAYEAPLIPAPVRLAKGRSVKKYVYNAWIDFAQYALGWHDVTFKAVNVRGDARPGLDWRAERIIVAPPLASGIFEDSDSIVPQQNPGSSMSVGEWVNSLPTVVHQASTNSFPVQPKTVLVQRLDQLGDLSVSVPALKRLRQLMPNARIVGLLSPSNEELGRSLDVFDEVLVADVPDDPIHMRRVIDRKGQLDLSKRLAPYKFDVAIDLAVSGVTQNLLPLSGAPVQLSFGGAGWKAIGFDLSTRDPKSSNDVMRHSARTRALIEALGAWLNSGAEIVRRSDLSKDRLRAYGLEPEDRFVVLHAGARIKFTQWPYFAELARKLFAETITKIVVMAENDVMAEKLHDLTQDNDRILILTGKLEFDDFDAFLSYCDVFVGNDSGPKHLAALRGAKVVSIHSSRINWNEWGQEQTGVVLSRRVPCAGCSLHFNSEECARGVVCVTKITVEEVFREVVALM